MARSCASGSLRDLRRRRSIEQVRALRQVLDAPVQPMSPAEIAELEQKLQAVSHKPQAELPLVLAGGANER